jgi:hypothetical protein
MSTANCVVYDSNGVHLARKAKKEEDLTQKAQSFAEGTEELCRGGPKRLYSIDGKGYRQRSGVSLVCESGQRPQRQ